VTDAPQQGSAPSPIGLPCPVCRVDLVMSERQGIEIDYCPKCRGVWLDRGELDKIIERAAAEQPAAPGFLGGAVQQGGGSLPPQPPARFLPDQGGSGPWGGGQRHGQDDDHGRGRGSFLSRLFDD
jgi:uncharacterized protein